MAGCRWGLMMGGSRLLAAGDGYRFVLVMAGWSIPVTDVYASGFVAYRVGYRREDSTVLVCATLLLLP